MSRIDVSFTLPEGLKRDIDENAIIVVVDILRFTSTACAAFSMQLASLIPVADIHQAKEMKEQGYRIAGESEGVKLDFADYGNSPYDFLGKPEIKGETLVFCTTNGTRVLNQLKDRGRLVLGAFSNLTVLSEWLIGQQKPVFIQCAGWNDHFCLEDAYFAGALSEMIASSGNFHYSSDAVSASIILWQSAKLSLKEQLVKTEHYKRLRRLGAGETIDFISTCDTTDVIPVFSEKSFINIYKS